MTQFSIQNISFSYGTRKVLDNLTVSFPEKKLIGVVGPNGCGKSTLISLLANLQAPSKGKVLFGGKPVNDYGRRELAQKISYLPQNPICPRGLTVEQVLRFGRQPYQSLLRQFSKTDAAKVSEIIDLLQLGPILHRPMEHLSGGQRQKAWLGMVLVQDTDVVLLDEPTSALDIGHQHEVLECIHGITIRGKTVILVIHDLAAAARFCDELLALKNGVIAEFGAPAKVINVDLIRKLYGVQVEIMTAPSTGTPVIIPLMTTEGLTTDAT